MLTCLKIDRQSGDYEDGGAELLESAADDDRHWLWVNIDGAMDEETTALLSTRFGLHTLALQDASRNRHPPKLETFSDHTFLIFKGLAADSDSIDCRTIQVPVFISERYLVTRHSDDSPSIRKTRRLLETDVELRKSGPGSVAVKLSRAIVDRYLKVLLDLEPRLEELEAELTGDDAEAVLNELVTHRADLIRLQRVFHYQVEVTEKLQAQSLPGFNEDDMHGLVDLHEQEARARSLCTLYYQLAADLIEGYISVSSHRLNQIMKVLTIITAVFVPLSFLAGIYGMNFENMPELSSQWGYFALLTVMGSVAVTLLYIFRRKRWL